MQKIKFPPSKGGGNGIKQMKTKPKPINVFSILEHREPIKDKENLGQEVNTLLNNIYRSRKQIEFQILTSIHFYRQLMSWIDLINSKEISIKDLLRRGSYTKEELKSKLEAFLLIIGAFKRYIDNPTKDKQKQLYQYWLNFGFNNNKINSIKEAILNKRIKTSREMFNSIVSLQAVINACTARVVEIHAPMAIDLANRRGLKFEEGGVIVEDHQDDLVQAGLLGLFIACQHWEPNREALFSTYAWYWIGSEFEKYFNKKDLVTLPRNLISLRKTINKISAKNRIPKSNVSDFKNFLHYSDRRIEAAMSNEGCISLNDIVSEEYDTDEKGLEFLTDKQDIIQEVSGACDKTILEDICKRKLSQKEFKILSMRYGLLDNIQRELSDIADEFGMTSEGVRKSLKSSIIKIIPEVVKRFGADYDETNPRKVLEMHCEKR